MENNLKKTGSLPLENVLFRRIIRKLLTDFIMGLDIANNCILHNPGIRLCIFFLHLRVQSVRNLLGDEWSLTEHHFWS